MTLELLQPTPILYHIPKRIVIHCSDSKNGERYSIDLLRKDHLDRGFSDIGYHLVIQPDGQVDNGRPLNQVGAHTQGHNTGSIGICLIGKDKFSAVQFDALRYKIDSLMMMYDMKKTEIYCHYQFDTAIAQGKTCPNVPINVILIWYYNISRESVITPYLLGGK